MTFEPENGQDFDTTNFREDRIQDSRTWTFKDSNDVCNYQIASGVLFLVLWGILGINLALFAVFLYALLYALSKPR